MLSGKGEFGIFEEVVHEDDEFAHDGGHGDEGFFTVGAEPQIQGFEDVVVAHGTQRGHVECAPHGAASAADMAHTFDATAVAVVRRDAREGGGGGAGELPEFRHLREQGDGDDCAHAGNGFQSPSFMRKVGIGGDELGQFRITLCDLAIQSFEELPGLADAERVGVMFGVVALGGARLQQLPPPLRSFTEL